MLQSLITGHRWFFAVRPPIALARQIANAASWFETSGEPLGPERLHVTMDMVDDRVTVSSALETVLCEIGEAVCAAPFAITFDHAVGSATSVALRPRRMNSALVTLHDRISSARKKAGVLARNGYRFAPHMTLGYRGGASFCHPIAAVGWPVEDFVLVHSNLGRSRHDIVGRWALTGVEAQLPLF